MDYKEKYEKALERCKEEFNFNNLAYSHEEIKQKLKHVFPELKESEDERIRKEILNVFKQLDECTTICGRNYDYAKWIAWLEKQGVQKSADKVGPKFKVGDWVVYCNEDVDLIMGVEKTGYIINKGGGYIPFVCEDDMRLWTIENAKDGDVLSTKKGNPFIYDKNRYNNGLAYYYAGIDANEELTLKNPHNMLSHFGELRSVFPATKEQRDLLFQKIKEAGYEWDGEKKELKKIEQKTAEWSEEDENERKRVVGLLEGWLYTFTNTCYAEDCKCGIAWLKSLKRRMEGE